jgi:hypothetical protein|tara:strand:+ start:408 stop:1802 length:1395 start_codon:yes stop_codon:yes gene_type:complete
MELFPATKTGILKKGPSGENLSFADDAQGSLSRNFKTVASGGTSDARVDELPTSQTLRSRGESLQFPPFTGDPAYQARVSFQMFALEPTQPGATAKSHVKTLEDNIAPKGTNVFFSNDANVSVGPQTINSSLETLQGDDDEALEILERRLDTAGATASRNNLIAGGVDGAAGAAAATAKNSGASKTLSGFTGDKIKAFTGALLDNNTAKAALNTLAGGLSFQPVTDAPVVDMFFPLTLQYNDQAQYDNAELGFFGAAATAAAEAGGNLLTSTISALVDGTTNVFDIFRNNTRLGEQALRLSAARGINAVGSLGATGVRNALTLQNRVVVNPNVRALFRGVALREFSFQFKMIAESAGEAETIRKIVEHFRTQMYPDAFSANLSNGVSADLGYKFPNVFKITFKYRGSINKKLPQIKYCYLRNVAHTINPTGGTFRRDGQASEIDLTLSFVEYKTLTKKDIQEGY